jgi:drug/metabolite transporter (DMT)-like permease
VSKVMLNWKPYAALLTVYLIWGTTAGVIRLGVDTIPPALLPCLRFTLSGIILMAYCLLKGEVLPSRNDLKTHAIIGMLLFFGGNSIVCWTVQHVATSFSGILVATTPFWMVWLSSMLPPREKIPLLSMLGILIGFIGMLILLSPQLTHLGSTSAIFWWCIGGLMLMSFSWALGSIYARKHATSSSLLMSVGLQNLIAGIALIPLCLGTVHNWQVLQPSFTSIASLVYLVLFGTITATPCYLYVVKTLPVSISSTFAYVSPVIAMFFGWMFLDEPITRNMIIGAAVILSGVVLVQYINMKRAVQPALAVGSRPTLQEVSCR